MDLTPQPQSQQVDQSSEKGLNLTFQIILNTILVILGFSLEFYLLETTLSRSNLGGLALLAIFFWVVIIGIPLMIISIVLLIIAEIKLNKNPKVSENIAKIYLTFSLLFIVLALPFTLSILPLSPILFYNWAFITIFLKSKKAQGKYTQFITTATEQTKLINKTYQKGRSLIYTIKPYFKIILIIFNLTLLILVFVNFVNESVFSIISIFIFSLPVQIAMMILLIKNKTNNY